MKKILFGIALFYSLIANAQNYLIDFKGTGASSTVTTVKVENLTQGRSLTMNGSDILRLNVLTGINSIDYNQSSAINIYPNPMSDKSIIQVQPPVSGEALITIFDMFGNPVIKIQNYLDNGLQEYRISGLKSGLYLVNIKGDSYQYSGKLLCNSGESSNIRLEKISSNQITVKKSTKVDSKGDLSYVEWDIHEGDWLKYTGISGDYSAVKTHIPTSNETITFNFVACKDADNNNYTIVEIGDLIWMAEDLKTTKLNDATFTSIPNLINSDDWINTSTPAYCWFVNDPESYSDTYGILYNWYAVNTGMLCPTNWHVATRANWLNLINSLGGESIAGGKLKETGTAHWMDPNTGATNESGFSALPGGLRSSWIDYGYFADMGAGANWWTATPFDSYSVWEVSIYYTGEIIYFTTTNQFNIGYSVRCVKDN